MSAVPRLLPPGTGQSQGCAFIKGLTDIFWSQTEIPGKARLRLKSRRQLGTTLQHHNYFPPRHLALTSWLGCQTTCLTSCVWELRTLTHSYSSSSSTVEAQGWGAETGWQAPKCTWRDLDSPSQTHTLLSRLQVARRLPDGAQATDLTSFSWPSRVVTHCEQ